MDTIPKDSKVAFYSGQHRVTGWATVPDDAAQAAEVLFKDPRTNRMRVLKIAYSSLEVV